MIRKILTLAVMATLFGVLIAGVTPAKTAHAATLTPHESPAQTQFIRMLGPNGCHFYTASIFEAQAAANAGYSYEGNAGYIFPPDDTTDPATYNLFKLYRLRAPDGCHFYTTSWQEVLSAEYNYGDVYEGNAGWVCLDSAFDPTTFENWSCSHFSFGINLLYRLYNPRLDDHFYTISSSEATYVVQHYGYTNEGRAGSVG